MKNTISSKKNKNYEKEALIALAGNPNVGKSTVFNRLTGMKQHTGNWAGKTVSNVTGKCVYKGIKYIFADIPGTYSLLSHSKEEEEARNFICFKKPDITVVVCDASCILRNLNLVLQIIEITDNVILCLNLMDEAEKKGIKINIPLLEERIKIPVIPMTASKNKGFKLLMEKINYITVSNKKLNTIKIKYDTITEKAIKIILNEIENYDFYGLNKRWLALRLIESEYDFINILKENTYITEYEVSILSKALEKACEFLYNNKINNCKIRDKIADGIIKTSEKIGNGIINSNASAYSYKDRFLDSILTGKYTAYPIMFLILMIIMWITIKGANYPSAILSDFLFSKEDSLFNFFLDIGVPIYLCEMIVFGVYRVLCWVVSVMFPPMAIFFPLFTLLEDLGYLPRMAFNMDCCFKKCNACGKQGLCMAMGFGCNAVGVSGCRIIDSPRERLIAIITNSFVPCNGRFPTLIAIITMFFVGTGAYSGLFSAFMLSSIIIFGIIMTLIVSKILGNTILKGVPSSFTLEMPPYRKPQITTVIINSIFDRTLFVLGRAVSVAIPAGLIIWLMSNTFINNNSILSIVYEFLDPFASIFGLDGVILTAFILGFPANEIVIPIIIMAYMGNTSLTEMESINSLKALLINNGWTIQTALSVIIFSLMHWPCSTTCLTIKKETGSIKWTVISIIVPVICGLSICGILNIIFKII